MKVFLHIFLYLNVSVCSLFFVIWLLTSSPFVETADAADPNAIPSVKEEEVKSLKSGDTDVNSPSAVEAATSKSEDSPTLGDEQRVPAESSPDLQNTAKTNSAPTSPSVPPPPPSLPDNKDFAAEEPSPPAMLENKDSASAEPVPAPPVPETTGDSDSLTEMLKSNDQFHEDKGSNKEMVKGLMDLNKKVVDMYKMLSDYQYDTVDRRDPFVPFKEAKEVKGKAPMDHRECPGKEHNLSDIKLVGIQWGSKTQPSTALFRSPDNKTFFLQKNDCLGQSKATIYKIREGGVVVVEPRTLNPDKINDESAFSLIEILLSRGKGLEVRDSR